MNYKFIIEKYVGKEVNFWTDFEIVSSSKDGVKITKWNISEKPKPTMDELETIWQENKKDYYKDIKTTEIKQKAHKIIINRYPDWKQRNMAQRAVELVDIKTERALTTDEEAERQKLKDIKAWVDSIRSQSNVMEADLKNLTADEIKSYEVSYTT